VKNSFKHQLQALPQIIDRLRRHVILKGLIREAKSTIDLSQEPR